MNACVSYHPLVTISLFSRLFSQLTTHMKTLTSVSVAIRMCVFHECLSACMYTCNKIPTDHMTVISNIHEFSYICV